MTFFLLMYGYLRLGSLNIMLNECSDSEQKENASAPQYICFFLLINVQYSKRRTRWGVSHICCTVCRPHLTHRQFETVVPTEDSVITEMTSTLRDWGAMWKQLFVVNTVWANTVVRPQPDTGYVNSTCTDADGRNILFVFQLLMRGNCFWIIFTPDHYISLVQQ